MCFHVLQNERGLSVHFLIDNDGTIYQTLDLGHAPFRPRSVNEISVGVELCQPRRRERRTRTTTSSGRHRSATKADCKINDNTILAYDYTSAQYESMQLRSARRLARLFPNLPAELSAVERRRAERGTRSPYGSTFGYSGYLGHYHLTNQKWDPGPFDFKEFIHRHPRAHVLSRSSSAPATRPDIPDDPDKQTGHADAALRQQREGRRRRLLPGRPLRRLAAVARRRPHPRRRAPRCSRRSPANWCWRGKRRKTIGRRSEVRTSC